MIPWQLGVQQNAAMYSHAHAWMQTFDCCCRQFVYVLEQTGMTTDELGKNFHMHARFFVKGKVAK